MMKYLQKLGKALMLPVAVLPICGILMGLGYALAPGVMGVPGAPTSGAAYTVGFLLVKAGGALIDNMAWLFAIGAAVGLADNDGTAGLAGLVSFLMMQQLLNPGVVSMVRTLEEGTATYIAFQKVAGNSFIGILAAVVGAACYNKFKNIQLPDWLAFFSGKRFVAIATGLISILVSVVLLFVWPLIFGALVAVGNGIGAFDIDHCIREDGTLNDTAATVLSIFPSAYVEKSPSGQGLRGFFCVPEDYVFDKTIYYINNRSKGLEVYMPGATNRFVTVTGDVYRTGEIPNDPEAMTTLLDSLMKRSKQVQNNQLRHHSYLSDDAVIVHAEEAGNSDKFKKLYAGDWQELYDSQSDADMAMLSILAFWCGCDEEQMDRIFRTSGLMRDKWDRKQAGTTYGAISIRNAVNTAASVYVPVNAQDIVDEEFSKLDEDEYAEFQPDLSKITVTLEEMAPHTNARYGRNEIGMGNMFADYFKQIARYNSERKGWYVYDGSVWRPDKGNLKVSELAKLLADKLYVFALTITEEDARKRFIDRVRKLQLRKNRETILKDAMSVYPISMQAFDRNKYLFNCKNGTMDMRTLEFREHRPEDYLTMESPTIRKQTARAGTHSFRRSCVGIRIWQIFCSVLWGTP